MTDISYRIENYKPDHSTFGGIINETDFYTGVSGQRNKYSPIAQKIASDHKFDKECEKNIKFREMGKKFNKNYIMTNIHNE